MKEPQRRTGVGAPMRRLSPQAIGLIALGLFIAGALVFLVLRGGNSAQDRLGDDQVGSNIAAEDPEARCAATSNNERIKRELFLRAGATRPADAAAFNKVAGYAVLRSEAPLLRGYNQRADSVTCSAYVSIDLPPGISTRGLRTLSADVGFELRGETLSLTDAEGLIAALASLSRDGQSPEAGLGDGEPVAEQSAETPELNVDASESAAKEVGPGTDYPGRPSYDCGMAQTRGEVAVCSNSSLAALDVTMATQYRRAVADSTPAQRALLVQTRDRFLAYRDNCPTVGCIRDAYMGRMREIRDIMEDRYRPQ